MIQILFTVEIHHNKIKIMNEDQTLRARLVTSTELESKSFEEVKFSGEPFAEIFMGYQTCGHLRENLVYQTCPKLVCLT